MSFLPGMFPSGVVVGDAGSGSPTSVSEQDTATSTAETITAPASINSGDLLVMLDFAEGSTLTPTTVLASGFTSLKNNSFNEKKAILSYKIADGTEDGATLTGMNGASSNQKALYQFRPDNPISTVTPSAGDSEATNGNPTSQSIPASGGSVPLIALAAYSADRAINPRSFSPAKDGELNASTLSYLAYKIYNSSPADITADMDDEGGNANILQSIYLELS